MTYQKDIEEKRPYDTFAQGIFVVKAKNSSFNSDFSGLPRRLPDKNGTIYATDKALKYCIRKYLLDANKGQVFVWRRYDENDMPLDINQNYKIIFKKEIPKRKQKKGSKEEEVPDNKQIIKDLASAIDVRLFGVTYAGETNVSITGSVQLSYGINKFFENIYYNNDILSPYRDLKKEEAEQQTLGNETKTLESHYVYDFMVNPNNLIDDLEFLPENEKKELLLSQRDISNFKEAICKGVSYVNSASKIGCESEFFMYIEMKASKDSETGKIQSHILPLMKDFIKIEKDGNKTKIDLTELFGILKTKYHEYITSIEVYYDNSSTDVVGVINIGNVKPSIQDIVITNNDKKE